MPNLQSEVLRIFSLRSQPTGMPERSIALVAVLPGMAAALMALFLGAAVGGLGVGVSAALTIALICGDLVVAGLSVSWAARISLAMLQIVSLAGFGVRMAMVIAGLALLNGASWSSPVAIKAAAIPALLLVVCGDIWLMLGTRLGRPVLHLDDWGLPLREGG